MKQKKLRILLAEDNVHDVVAIKRAWKKYKIANELIVVNDGEECLDYLMRKGRYSTPQSSPRPDVILLDISMPKVDGIEVLRQAKLDKELSSIPMVMLTTSNQEEDVRRSYELGANAYIKKPVGFEKFAEIVRAINRFWELVDQP